MERERAKELMDGAEERVLGYMQRLLANPRVRESLRRHDAEPCVSAVATGTGWMKIESAPLDGTQILVTYRHKGRAIYRIAKGEGHGMDPDWPREQMYWRFLEVPTDRHIEPTHWMPLPLPPSP